MFYLSKDIRKNPEYNSCIYKYREGFIWQGQLEITVWLQEERNLLGIILIWKFYKHQNTEIEINGCKREAKMFNLFDIFMKWDITMLKYQK